MPLKFFLNIDHNSSGNIDEKGRCVVRQSDRVSGEFSLIKASIFDSFTKVDNDYIRAIPYSRAREYLFQEYLVNYPPVSMDEENQNDVVAAQVHKLCSDEWLGFVSMIALRKIYNIKIINKKIDISKFSGIGKTLYESKSKIRNHGRELPVLSETSEGNDYIIYVQTISEDIPLGMLNPSIIFTPGFWNDKIKGNYPWTDGEQFINPLENMTRGEKMILYKWLDNAKRMCSGFPYVISILNEFMERIDLPPADIALLRSVGMEKEDWNTANYLPLEILACNVKLETLAVSEYDAANIVDGIVFNITDEKKNIGHKIKNLARGFLDNELLVKMHEKYKGDKRELKSFMDMFSYEGSKEILIIENDLSQHLENYIDISRVFCFSTESLKDSLRISKSVICNNKCYVLIPSAVYHTEKKKNLGVIEKILSMIKVKEEEDGVYLIYQFSSIARPKKIKFDYVIDLDMYEERGIDGNAPASFIWPNMENSAKYYMVCLRSKANPGYLSFVPRGYSIGAPEVMHYYEMNEWPEYFEVYQMENNSYKLKGMLPIDPPDTTHHKSETAVYSVDFGTSSTNVGVKVNIPKVNDFPSQTMVVSELSRDVGFNKKNEYLYGDHMVDAPFPTLFYENRIGTGTFRDGHAYFMETNQMLDIRDYKIKSDIKFGQNKKAKIDYIKSLLNYIFVDAKKAGFTNLELKISYSFSMNDPEGFIKSVQNIITEINPRKMYGLEVKQPEFVSESVAALKYVRQSRKENEIVVIDIGGGSVDVCVHSPILQTDDKPLRTASFMQGSRHFFINSFKKNYKFIPNLMKELEENFTKGSMSEGYFTNPDEFRKRVLNGIFEGGSRRKGGGINKEGFSPDASLENWLALNMHKGGISVNLGDELKNTFLSGNQELKKYYQTVWMFQMSAIMFY